MTCASSSPAPLGTDFTPLKSPPTVCRSFRLAWLRRCPYCPVSLSTYYPHLRPAPRRREEEWSRSRGTGRKSLQGCLHILALGHHVTSGPSRHLELVCFPACTQTGSDLRAHNHPTPPAVWVLGWPSVSLTSRTRLGLLVRPQSC